MRSGKTTERTRIKALNFLTDFADQAVVLPLAGGVLMVLLALGWRRGALAWGAGVAAVLAVMLVLKLVTLACGPGWGVVSPSGHTATAAVVYGGLLALMAPRSAAGTGVAVAAGGAMALVFGLTRLALGVHTVGDVLVGAAVGVAGAVAIRRFAGARPARVVSPWLVLVVCVVVLVFHGNRLEAESRIHWLALDVWPLDRCK
jgi:membrane-associated phospholipid phosphatase